MSDRLRLLLVCSRNQWRSPTAERIYARDPRVQVRSAGTSKSARRRVRETDLEWADIVFVMEHDHARRIRAMGGRDARVEILEIPDDYPAMDPELIDLVRERVEPVLENALR